MPVWGVLVRMAIYVAVGVAAVTVFSAVGAPVLAAAELSISVEAVFMLVMLNRRLETPIRPLTAVGKGLIAALVSGAVTYAVALYLPGPGLVTSLIGMVVGGGLAVAMVWSEAKQLFRL